jgi:hypothetical protein
MNAQFKLVFNGKVLPDHHPAVVRGRLQKLLKTTDEQAEMLFSSKPVVVKKLADEATMLRYRKAFANAGAVLEVVALLDVGADVGTVPGEAAAPDSVALELAAVGSDLLTSAERGPLGEPQPIAVEHLSLAFAGENLQAHAAVGAEPLAPDTSYLQLDELGARLADAAEKPPPAAPDVEFDLAEAGEALVDPAPVDDAPTPDFSHIKLEPTP